MSVLAVLSILLAAAPEPPAALAAEPEVEAATLQRLVTGETWPRRAIACMRLERYGCPDSEQVLLGLLDDEAWQVRAFAVRAAGRRGGVLPEAFTAREHHPRVLRAALRYGFTMETERLGRGVRYLARSSDLQEKMLAVELGAASGDAELETLARETLRTIVLRMNRIQAGSLSPRLALVTGAPDVRRHYLWHRWLRHAGRRFDLLPAGGLVRRSPKPNGLARLDAQEFAALESYVDDLASRSIDLAICLDTTASMSGELADAQGGIDDLMLFAGDVVRAALRVAIVAYRDERDDFETKGWDFTPNIELARRRLWSLVADGGGDTPEAVYSALRMAFRQLGWNTDNTGVLVLAGDAPPHAGYGGHCVRLSGRAADFGVTTHTIQAEGRMVKYFQEIAEAGGGRCVSLSEHGSDSLIIEIAGLTLGERYDGHLREFFRAYLELCR